MSKSEGLEYARPIVAVTAVAAVVAAARPIAIPTISLVLARGYDAAHEVLVVDLDVEAIAEAG